MEECKRKTQGLYDPRWEHDNCGIGAVVNQKGIKSHATVENALTIVENLEHRAGKDASGKTGDGVGILLQISHKFFSMAAKEAGISIGKEREYGIGMFFMPQGELNRKRAMKMFEIIVEKEGLEFLGWREVPVNKEVLGETALSCMPYIVQAFIKKPTGVKKGLDFDRKLYIARRIFENSSNEDTYVVSLSSRTIVYKGMFLVGQLRSFFRDLQDENYESAIALVHSRFSTNTQPSWRRAHPNRFIVHNGEINTIAGNADKMHAREESMASEYLKGDLHKILPVVDISGSDSARLDNTLEFLVMSGMELPLAVMITIPEPWANDRSMSRKKKEFYQYYATMMEPWDGPASILFSDGDVMGAVLDRNGLRPSRYYITDDGNIILSSEVGVLDIPEEKIVKKDRLRPGKMLLVDTVKGELIDDDTIKEKYAGRQPYGEWLDNNLTFLKDIKIPNKKVEEYTPEQAERLRRAFGYTYEECKTSILTMAMNGSEPIGAMGVDTPIPPLSERPQPLFKYFKQLFAQVTNPPIDALREKVVTATSVYIGTSGNILQEREENCNVLRIDNPILTNTDMLKIKMMKVSGFKVEVIPITYYTSTSLEKAIDHVCNEADRAYKDGANVLVLSDRGVDENHVAIPSLLAISALQQHLVKTKKRTKLSVILETAEPREVHHFATLIGFGASAINPYLALDTIGEMVNNELLDKDYYASVDDYCNSVKKSIIKIGSKMGISTIQSYMGSRIFEAIGISEEVINKYFAGVVSRVGGITMSDIEKQIELLHSQAFDPLDLGMNLELDSNGTHKSRSGKEKHLYNPQTIYLLQKATREGNYEIFKQYSELMDKEESESNLRGLMDFNFPKKGISIDEVESVDDIVKRFKTGAMSYGSISKEAHECMAIAMNRLGGKSNSGVGGESDDRLATKGSSEDRCSAIKQVASGRFGVTSRYLVSADEIQIKMAQGAKPGEGGHLPGKKVYPWVAKCRNSTTGVGLISPPPHHDIYSIEDLAQLIYDLKNANKDARISVKLVSEAGVGTIAAGVAKAGAGVILISGYDGGTGAAPESSVHNAGLPWELGLAETHQSLMMNGLRSKVVIETDGKLMDGRDVAIAAMLGAEEFGFATAPLVTMGCVMMRVCNLDTCPVGIATQNPELRKRFQGKPEYVENFMRFVAQELREYMAKLGVRTVNELVGRVDLLKKKDTLSHKGQAIKLDQILDTTYVNQPNSCFNPADIYDFELAKTVDEMVLLKEFGPKIDTKQSAKTKIKVNNLNRTTGTMLGAEITKRLGSEVAEDTYVVECQGSGGQSFGAFIPSGLTMRLTGDCNDYCGKGLSGGKIVVAQPKKANYVASENIIIGNVAFYGGTTGKAFINGVAGERFCVRNSGITAVVEGVGDHGCEYMTGGRVVVLGNTGKNFAAGMSGGVAYVLDERNDFYLKVNKELVAVEEVEELPDVQELKSMIEEHVRETESEKGKAILKNFDEYLPKFKKIIPHDYRRVLHTIHAMEEKGYSKDQAEIEAFYVNVGK